jgi:hypothetical protein
MLTLLQWVFCNMENYISSTKTFDEIFRTFSSEEQANKHRLKRDIDKSDIEKLQMFCQMIRINKMFSIAHATERHRPDLSNTEDKELLKFWEALNSNGVEYIMAGGMAVQIQGVTNTASSPGICWRIMQKTAKI